MNWKAMAIIFIFLFFVETAFLTWGLILTNKEEKQTYECLYNICGESYDAEYRDEVCTCYDLDIIGNYIISKTEYMG